jgi:SdrD B-like protein/PKD domain-containing protein/beta-propeller repeat-containing protein
MTGTPWSRRRSFRPCKPQSGKGAPRLRRLSLDWLEPRTLLAGDFVFVDTFGSTGSDLPRAVAVDPAGNSYVAGEFRGSVDFDPGPASFLLTTNPSTSPDGFVAKYSPTGAFLWAQQIGSTSVDFASDLALDPAGNLWVTGFYIGTVDFDAGPDTHTQTAVGAAGGFILKLDASGGYQWVGSIDSLNGETLQSIAVDGQGNVLVAGQFNGTGDFDPGPGTFNLTSQVNGTTSTFDAFLAKIDNSGTFLWARAWGGNALSFNGDWANDVTADAEGNSYVFGTFLGAADLDPGPGTVAVTAPNNFTSNYYVSQFDAGGGLTWGRAFLGGGSLSNGDVAVDSEGNVYTTAALQGTVDFDPGPGVANLTAVSGGVDAFTSKLDANGKYVWAVKQGGNNVSTEPYGMVVDDNGDVYTTGQFNAPSAAPVDFDPGPNVLSLTSLGSTDTYVSRLDNAGRFISVRRIGGTALDRGRGIALNRATGEIHVAGEFAGTVDFDPGPGTVLRTSSAGSADTFLLKLRQNEVNGRAWNDFNGDGVQNAGEPGVENVLAEIVTTFNGTIGDSDDRVLATVATDGGGNYRFRTPQQGLYYVRFLPPTESGLGYQFTIADAGGDDALDSDVLPTLGRTNLLTQTPGVPLQNVSAGLSAVPSELAFAFGLGGGGNQQGRAVLTDAAGNTYVAGRASGATLDLDPGPGIAEVAIRGGDDAFLAKYNAAGGFLWGHSYGGTLNDSIESLAFDAGGNLVVAGFFRGLATFDTASGQTLTASGTASDAFVAKVDAGGNLLWVRQVGGTSDDAALGVAVDADDGIYVTGQVTGSVNFNPPGGPTPPAGGGTDVFALKLTGGGAFQWVARIGAGASGADVGNDIKVAGGTVYVAGKFQQTVDFNPDPLAAHNLTAVGGDDLFLWRIDAASGGFIGAFRVGGALSEQATGLAIAADGSLFMTGFYQGTVDFDPGPDTVILSSSIPRMFVTRSEADGDLLWARSPQGSGTILPGKIAATSGGETWSTGNFTGTVDFDPLGGTSERVTSGLSDIFLWHLDAAGELADVFTLGGLGTDVGAAVAVAPNEGRIAITGSFEQTADFEPGAGLLMLGSLPTAGVVTTQDAFVWVLGLNSAPIDILLSKSSVAENSAAGTVVGNVLVVDPDAGDTHTLALLDSAGGRFALLGSQLVVADASLLNFEADASHSVLLRATDAAGESVERWLTIEVLNVNEAPIVMLGDDAATVEGSQFLAAGSFADPDSSDSWTATVDYGDGGGPRPLPLQADKTFNLSFTYGDNGSYTVTVVVVDAGGLSGTDTLVVNVANVAPHNVAITSLSQYVVAVGAPATFAGAFADAGTLDTHTAQWTFRHVVGSSTIVETRYGTVTETGGSGTVSNVFVFDNDALNQDGPGVYTVTLTVTDDDTDQTTSESQTFVVYDPSEGFVTGGGWINSPAGAFVADPLLTGKANFGFVSKYQKGTTTPTGQTEFQFKAGDLNFHSASYEWLVVAGARGQYKGTGTINGAGNYGFLLTAIDGQVNGGGGADKLRMKIWDKSAGDAIVYDNGLGSADDDASLTPLAGGSILIHTSGQALHADGPAAAGRGALLSADALAPAVAEAIDAWSAAGATVAQIETLSRVDVQLASLSGELLGMASPANIIWIDVNAGGYGWDVGSAPGGVDLTSVLAHELGHVLGLEDLPDAADVMGSRLGAGELRLPTLRSLDPLSEIWLSSRSASSGSPLASDGLFADGFSVDARDSSTFAEIRTPDVPGGLLSSDMVGSAATAWDWPLKKSRVDAVLASLAEEESGTDEVALDSAAAEPEEDLAGPR